MKIATVVKRLVQGDAVLHPGLTPLVGVGDVEAPCRCAANARERNLGNAEIGDKIVNLQKSVVAGHNLVVGVEQHEAIRNTADRIGELGARLPNWHASSAMRIRLRTPLTQVA